MYITIYTPPYDQIPHTCTTPYHRVHSRCRYAVHPTIEFDLHLAHLEYASTYSYTYTYTYTCTYIHTYSTSNFT